MPDRRKHRGPHPQDEERFAPAQHAALRSAVGDLCWLLSRGYAHKSTLKLVGDRYRLDERQREAVRRCASSDAALVDRTRRRLDAPALGGRALLIDGFNVLTTVEAALGGCVLLLARDGCVRDMASVHGSYRKVEETRPAIGAIGSWLAEHGVGSARWLLDRPVSNSGRLREILLDAAGSSGWEWRVDLVDDPDPELAAADGAVVASADAGVLDRCGRWFPLAAAVVRSLPEAPRAIDLTWTVHEPG